VLELPAIPAGPAITETTYRPVWVTVQSPGEAEVLGRDTAVLTIPDDLTPAERQVAEMVALWASVRLCMGDTLSFALRRLALGRDRVRELLEMRGIKLDRKTVGKALAKLCQVGTLTKVGQLGDWFDYAAGKVKRGAFVYALNVGLQQIGSRARSAFERSLPVIPMNATVRGQRRVDRCLQAALRYAQEGNRNALGFWLAMRCRDIEPPPVP
jgi:hypothetical protein